MSNMGIKNEIVMELSIKLAEKELCDNHDKYYNLLINL